MLFEVEFLCADNLRSIQLLLLNITITLGEDISPLRYIISKWENPYNFLYQDGYPDHTQNLIGSKLGEDPTSDFCLNDQTNKQIDRETDKRPWKVIPPS